MPANDRLIELARRHGVGVEYWNWTGALVRVDDATLVAVLRALDVAVDLDDATSIDAALIAADEREWRRTLPASVVVRRGRVTRVPVHVPHGDPVRLVVALEDGGTLTLRQVDDWTEPRELDGALVGQASFEIPADTPLGWHGLVALGDGDRTLARTTLVVTPEHATVEPPRSWGIMAQLYQARSRDSWGLGDLGDAGSLVRWGAGLGADFLLVNPLHAPAPVVPIEPSPYLPTTRRFVDPLAISINEVVAGLTPAPEDASAVAALGREAAARNTEDTIDRDAAWLAKRAALALLHPLDLAVPERRRRFESFVARGGDSLRDFASYCALAERHGMDWGAWPKPLRSVRSDAVSAFRAAEASRVEFFTWCQFVADEQLAAVQASAREAGMSIGVIHDLAVGVHPQGADTWALPDAIARGVSVGAPPDQFNQLGQNWSQPPWRPDRLAELGYAPYREMLQGVLRHAGGIRIDHILGLFRLWWIPDGQGADAGTYVRYDYEAMIGILLLEAERAGALVIGEDLGVVEELTRTTMRERGVAGTSILWFEWDDRGRPRAADEYRERCLATVTTHDLPPTAGYLGLEHVELRERLGLLTRSVAEEREHERGVIAEVTARLVEAGHAEPDADVDELVTALHAYLAAGSSRWFGVALADLAGDRRSINQPGTYREYPNWSLPLAGPDGRPVTVEDLAVSPTAERIAHAARRGQPHG